MSRKHSHRFIAYRDSVPTPLHATQITVFPAFPPASASIFARFNDRGIDNYTIIARRGDSHFRRLKLIIKFNSPALFRPYRSETRGFAITNNVASAR